MNIRKLGLTAFVFMLITALVGCSDSSVPSRESDRDEADDHGSFSTTTETDENAEPREEKLLADFRECYIEEIAEEEFTIESVRIDRMKTEGQTARYWCTLTLKNEMYSASASIEATYSFYEIGGWILDSVDDFEIDLYTPIAGYSEKLLINKLTWDYYEEEVIEHNTDLENGTDIITVRYSDPHGMYDEVGILECKYSFQDNAGWVEEDIQLVEKTVTVHPEGSWSYSGLGSNLNYSIRFESYTDSTITLAYYFIDNLDDEYVIKHDTYDVTVNEDGDVCFGDHVLLPNGVSWHGSDPMKSADLTEKLNGYTYLGAVYGKNYDGDMVNVVKFPDIIGKNKEEAKKILDSLGLIFVEIGNGDKGTVTQCLLGSNINCEEGCWVEIGFEIDCYFY